MIITIQIQAFAEGYHAGRMDWEADPSPSTKEDYMAGYEAGLEDRSEADENA